MKKIQVIAHFEEDGKITPYRLRYKDSVDANHVVKVERILTTELNTFSGRELRIFNCTSVIDDHERMYQLRYDVLTCQWFIDI